MMKKTGSENYDGATEAFLDHTKAERVMTQVVMTTALREKYPNLHLVAVPTWNARLLSWAQLTGEASFSPIQDDDPTHAPIAQRMWAAPSSRDKSGILVDELLYGKFMLKWKKHEFLLYIASGRDGVSPFPKEDLNYILHTDSHAIDDLVATCCSWTTQLHDAIWVFDQGRWSQSSEFYKQIQSADWANVILDEDQKKAIRHDIEDFYDSGDRYRKLRVPWKRGLIFHGPPGNGKTISIKATMHELMKKDPFVPTLYVRSLTSFGGPEFSVKQIFNKARQEAPCFLVFEDLDSIVTDDVRSYFLNEVDGLNSNNGVLMVGSTNHLDRLDPGLSKRPSRFDRKYLFPDPNLEQRTMYAQFWQGKLKDNPDIEFPDKLCPAIASITDGFSFAYMQEAFVAALLALARGEDDTDGVMVPSGQDPDYGGLTQAEAAAAYAKIIESLDHKDILMDLLDKSKSRAYEGGDDGPAIENLPLWRELQKQVALLREGMDDDPDRNPTSRSSKIPGAPRAMPPLPHMKGLYGQRDAHSVIDADSVIQGALKERASAPGWSGTVILDH